MKTIITSKVFQSENILIMILVGFFISEALTTICYQTRMPYYNYSAIAKALFIVYVLIYSIRNYTKLNRPLLFFMGAMSLFFIVGQFVFNDYSFGSHLFQNVVFFSRYLFVFIILLFLLAEGIPFSRLFYTVYEKLVIVNCLVVLTAILFDIQIFQTYYNRFGSAGVFMTPSMITYFNALALTYFLYHFLYSNKKGLELILVVVVCFLSGTKALLFFVALTALHVLIIKKIYLKKTLYYILTVCLVLGYLLRNTFVSFVNNNFHPLIEVYKEYGVIAALTSLRSENLKEDFLPVIQEKWNAVNYLFGGTDFEIYRVEFEPFDVFLFFGIIGMGYYFSIYFRKVMNFKEFDTFGKIQMIILLTTVIISGNFFNNAPMAMYLVTVIGILQNKDIIRRMPL